MPKITVDLEETALHNLLVQLKWNGKLPPPFDIQKLHEHPELFDFKGSTWEGKEKGYTNNIVLTGVSERSVTERSDTHCKLCNEPFTLGEAVLTYKDCLEAGSFHRGCEKLFPDTICGSTSQAQTRSSEVEDTRCVLCREPVEDERGSINGKWYDCHAACWAKKVGFDPPKPKTICKLCNQVLKPGSTTLPEFPSYHIDCIAKRDMQTGKGAVIRELEGKPNNCFDCGTPLRKGSKLCDSCTSNMEEKWQKRMYEGLFKDPPKAKDPKHPICPWCKKRTKNKLDLANIYWQGDTAWHRDCFFEYRHHW